MEGARPSFCGLRVKIEAKCVAQGHPGALGADAARTFTLWRFAAVMFALEWCPARSGGSQGRVAALEFFPERDGLTSSTLVRQLEGGDSGRLERPRAQPLSFCRARRSGRLHANCGGADLGVTAAAAAPRTASF